MEKLKENDIVYHTEYGKGKIIQVFKFEGPHPRRSRYPYLVKFDSGFQEQFLKRELNHEPKEPTSNSITTPSEI